MPAMRTLREPSKTYRSTPCFPQSGHCLRTMRTDIPPEHSSKSALDGQPKLPIEIAWHSTSRRRRTSPLLSAARRFTLANTDAFSSATMSPIRNSLPTDHAGSHAISHSPTTTWRTLGQTGQKAHVLASAHQRDLFFLPPTPQGRPSASRDLRAQRRSIQLPLHRHPHHPRPAPTRQILNYQAWSRYLSRPRTCHPARHPPTAAHPAQALLNRQVVAHASTRWRHRKEASTRSRRARSASCAAKP